MNTPTAGWTASKVKHLGRYINGYPFKPSDWSDSGKPIIRIQNLSDPDAPINRFEGSLGEDLLVRNGDILLSWSASLGAYEWDGEDAWLNQHIFKVDLDTNHITKGFFKWLAVHFMSALSDQAHGSTMQHLTKDSFGRFPVLLPPISSQSHIALWLEDETSQIDALVAEKERMLALLEEKRATLISRAVTRGLNPKAPTKPSGLEWLGDIPKHWKIERGKNVFAVRDERSEDGNEELLTVSHITGVTSRAEKEVYMFKADDMTGYKRCMKDDFVTNTLWAWMGAMGISPLDGIVSPDYHVYTSKGPILPDFMELLCRSKPFVAEVIRWSKGVWSSRLRLYPENFFEIQFPIPPQEEQKAIVAEIAAYREKTAKLVATLVDSNKLLKERRSALITAAVTGKIPLEEMTA